MTFVIENEALLITTKEAEEWALIVEIYDITEMADRDNPKDIVTFDINSDGFTASRRYRALVEILIATVDPESWEELSGPGSLDVRNGTLVVAQARVVHDKIESLLRALRATRKTGRRQSE